MRPWWMLLRASNLPTVWTNVLLGVALSAGPEGSWFDPSKGGVGLLMLIPLALMMLAGSAAYLGGMVMNDITDLDHDRSTSADRPLVRGQISLAAANTAMIVLFMASIWAQGAAIMICSNTWQPALLWSALLGAIWLYNLIHRSGPLSAGALMACCRGLLVLSAAAAIGPLGPAAFIGAAAVACWTGGITLLARGERGGEPRAAGWLALLVLSCLGPVGVWFTTPWAQSSGPLLGGLLVLGLAWIPAVWRFNRARRQGQAIVWAIMGLCVLDAACLLAASQLVAASAAMIAMALCMGLQRLQAGT
ncbi:MAG: UbiA family prenyltransferase [Phycisphaerales bacterium]|nr:UbiA family prenyltransferase [Phycisphaerales bacterium]